MASLFGSLFFIRTTNSLPVIGAIFWFAAGAAVEAAYPGTAATIGEWMSAGMGSITGVLW